MVRATGAAEFSLPVERTAENSSTYESAGRDQVLSKVTVRSRMMQKEPLHGAASTCLAAGISLAEELHWCAGSFYQGTDAFQHL